MGYSINNGIQNEEQLEGAKQVLGSMLHRMDYMRTCMERDIQEFRACAKKVSKDMEYIFKDGLVDPSCLRGEFSHSMSRFKDLKSEIREQKKKLRELKKVFDQALEEYDLTEEEVRGHEKEFDLTLGKEG